MKRLVYPLVLVVCSLTIAATFTTVTAMTLASYSKDGKKVSGHIAATKSISPNAQLLTVTR